MHTPVQLQRHQQNNIIISSIWTRNGLAQWKWTMATKHTSISQVLFRSFKYGQDYYCINMHVLHLWIWCNIVSALRKVMQISQCHCQCGIVHKNSIQFSSPETAREYMMRWIIYQSVFKCVCKSVIAGIVSTQITDLFVMVNKLYKLIFIVVNETDSQGCYTHLQLWTVHNTP